MELGEAGDEEKSCQHIHSLSILTFQPGFRKLHAMGLLLQIGQNGCVSVPSGLRFLVSLPGQRPMEQIMVTTGVRFWGGCSLC